MTKLLIQIDDQVREMTNEEFDYYSQIQGEAQAHIQVITTARESALSKLAALGLTEEEIAAL
jgi:DNA-binding NarL/FixJ family response regulator